MLGFTIIIPIPLFFATGIGIMLAIWIVHMAARARKLATLPLQLTHPVVSRRKCNSKFSAYLATLKATPVATLPLQDGNIGNIERVHGMLDDQWSLLYRQLQEVTGNTIRYKIVRKFCYHIEERPSSCGGTYETVGTKRNLSPLSLQGVQQILKAFPDCNQRGWAECILAKFMIVKSTESTTAGVKTPQIAQA